MATASINRPTLDYFIQENIFYTPIANDFFHHGDFGLKPRDASVLNYFLSKKPQGWVIVKDAVASSLGIGKTTVSRALTQLVKLGFARYVRNAKGYTEWFFSIPDSIVKQFSKSSEKPHSQKPHGVKPYRVNDSVLIKNNKLESNKETTNTAVVVPLPDYVNGTPTVKKEFGSLDAKLQASVLETLAAVMLCAGKVKNPTAYLLGLVRNAAKGSFLPSKQQTNKATTVLKSNKNLVLVNLRNELANLKQLYDLAPNEALLSQISDVELKLNVF